MIPVDSRVITKLNEDIKMIDMVLGVHSKVAGNEAAFSSGYACISITKLLVRGEL